MARSKYNALTDYLASSNEARLFLTFSKIEEIVGSPLPASASKHNVWWINSNQTTALFWLKADYIVDQYDMKRSYVKFIKDSDKANSFLLRCKKKNTSSNDIQPVTKSVKLGSVGNNKLAPSPLPPALKSSPTKIEWMQYVYRYAKVFLESITPLELRGPELERYLYIQKTFTTLNEVYYRLLGSLQNKQQSTNVIGFWKADRKELFSRILYGYDSTSVLRNYNENSMYAELCRIFPVSRKDEKRNLWRGFARSILSASEFMSNFTSADDFDQFVNSFSYNHLSKASLPMVLEQEVYGLGFALACDFLKELGYAHYPKPDVHIKDILSNLGLCEASDYAAYKSIIHMGEVCNDTPYTIDKTFWLIGSGYYYLHDRRCGSKKDEFINNLQSKMPSRFFE